MKKVISLITVFLACAVAACAVLFAGCSSESVSDTYAHLLDLSKYEIGDELPAYPNCEFDYKVDDDCIVHINNISAFLYEKNAPSENDTIEGYYKPYTIKVIVTGSVDPSVYSSRLYLSIVCYPTNGALGKYITIDEDGNFECEYEIGAYEIMGVYFYDIYKS